MATGYPVLDDDHRAMIAAVNALETAIQAGTGQAQLAETLHFLERYTHHHFRREEGYMLQLDCPAHHENCAAHAGLSGKIVDWRRRLDTGFSVPLLLEVYRELQHWVRHHLMTVDCQLRGCTPRPPAPPA